MYTYPAVNEEALEATNTFVDKALELIGIARDDTAIEADINPALALSGSEFLMEIRNSGGRWDGIQWHVHDGGDTAKGSGLSAGIETFPFGTTWLVEVDMSVNQTRKKNMGRIVSVWSPGGKVGGRDNGVENGGDLASRTGDHDSGRCQTAGDDGTRRDHDGNRGRNCLHGSVEQREKDGEGLLVLFILG